MNNIDFSTLLDLFKKSKNILLTTHLNPDGDAIGSVLGLFQYLKQIGKNPIAVLSDTVPQNLTFLEGVSEIQLFKENEISEMMKAIDLILILDLNEISRLRGLESHIKKSNARKVVIDHHLEPKEFADFYLVDTDASSTGELVYKLIRQDKKFKLVPSIAENLYAAILTDSGSFRFPRTDSEVHLIISDLIQNGADPVKIYENIYNQNSLNKIRLLGIGYSNLDVFFDGAFCLMTLRKEDFIKTSTNNSDLENFVESLMVIEGVKIGVLIAELPNEDEVKLSFRSKGDLSVRKLAMIFNGGGHLNASGARITKLSLNSVKKMLINEVEKLLFSK